MTHFKTVAFFIFLVYSLYGCQSNQTEESSRTTTFILVRHAEKADDGTEDPPLNAAGKQRAEALANHLKETEITAIYSTSYKRTRETVRPIADAQNLQIKPYDPFSNSLIDSLLQAESGGTVLLSGHSNTTPMLVNKLIGEEKYEQFDESDYNNLFIVMASQVGKGTALKLTF